MANPIVVSQKMMKRRLKMNKRLIEERKKLCSGCHDDFYNHRMNCTGKDHCWNLLDKGKFRKGFKPKCWHS